MKGLDRTPQISFDVSSLFPAWDEETGIRSEVPSSNPPFSWASGLLPPPAAPLQSPFSFSFLFPMGINVFKGEYRVGVGQENCRSLSLQVRCTDKGRAPRLQEKVTAA